MMQNKHLESIPNAAKIKGLGRDTMYALVRSQPDLPIVKVGKITKINMPLFEEWLEQITREGRQL